jgi:hypothetical protein
MYHLSGRHDLGFKDRKNNDRYNLRKNRVRGVVVGALKITSEYTGLEFVVKTYDTGSCSVTFKLFK